MELAIEAVTINGFDKYYSQTHKYQPVEAAVDLLAPIFMEAAIVEAAEDLLTPILVETAWESHTYIITLHTNI